MSGKYRRIVTLCLVLLISGGWVALASRSNGGAEAARPSESNRLFLVDPNLAGQTGPDIVDRELFFKMMGSVALVAVLGVAALYLSRKVLPRVTRAPGKEIHILETAYLGPRKALHLVEVGSHRLLIGSTNESITALAHVGDAWLDISKHEMDDTVKL